MKRRLTQQTLVSTVVYLATLVAVFFATRYFPAIDFDPDRFYHFAISRIYAASGYPATLPQAEDIGWGQAFAEKEFLFHVLSGFAWKLGGEHGVVVYSRVLFAFLMTTLGFVIARAAKSGWMVPVATFVIMLCCAQFSTRMNMIRPHVLAILVMTWQILAWRSGRWKLACVLAGAYTLAYHAFYVPLAINGIFIASLFLAGTNVSRHVAWTILSMAAAIIANPAFPQNIATGVQVLAIATQQTSSIPEYFFGGEIRLLNSVQLIKQHGYMIFLPLVLVLVLLVPRSNTTLTWNAIRGRKLRCPELFAVLGISLLFSALIFLTPRAFEIAVPAGMIALATLAGQHQRTGRWITVVFLVTFVAFHVPGSLDRIHATSVFNPTVAPASESIRRALSVIPQDGQKKVFNWSWWVSPFILYHRPDLRFIDLLDPTFLQRKSPEMSKLRVAVYEDRETDPWFVVRNVFHADYVMIPDSMAGRWATDPHFTLMKTPPPVDERYGFSVLKVAEHRIDRFVTKGRTGTAVVSRPFPEITDTEFRRQDIPIEQEWPRIEEHPGDSAPVPTLAFVDSFRTLAGMSGGLKPKDLAKLDPFKNSLCTRVSVDPAEIARITRDAGRIDYLGIGGGSWFGVWVNDEPLYQAENPFAPRLVDTLIDLRGARSVPPVRSIEAISCAKLSTNRAGLAISLWSKTDIESRCGNVFRTSHPTRWQIAGATQWECFGAPVVEKISNHP
ncbi:hypothetical protein EBZ80_11150 [bacterium]|nr:hypothetical protein [bacterium]